MLGYFHVTYDPWQATITHIKNIIVMNHPQLVSRTLKSTWFNESCNPFWLKRHIFLSKSRPTRLGSPIARAPSLTPSTSSNVEPPEYFIMDIQENTGRMWYDENIQIMLKVQSMSSAMFTVAIFNGPSTFSFYFKETWNNYCHVELDRLYWGTIWWFAIRQW